MKICIIDYGMGNIHSLASILNYIGQSNIVISSNQKDIFSSDRLILPGVGNFKEAMKIITTLNLDLNLRTAIKNQIPLLGICLGMQLLGVSSDEPELNQGLGFIDNKTIKFSSKLGLPIPHVGFNQVKFNTSDDLSLFKNIENQADFYFTHSHRMELNSSLLNCTSTYGEEFISYYQKDNIFGAQFHPELSQSNGIEFIKNFIDL